MTDIQEKILIVDDDARLRGLLQRFLEQQGYYVKGVENGELMDRAMTRELYSLVVLDIMLPGEDGLSICRRLRDADNRVPVIMLTAKGDDDERIEGLNAGADDYLPKPFNPKELQARVEAVLRRSGHDLPGAPGKRGEEVSFGPWKLNLANRTLNRDGEGVSLTTGEFAVLKVLAQNLREPMSRDKLMKLARGREWSAMERSIDVQVSRLRRIIEEDASAPRYLQTVWGVGYVLVPD